MLNTLWGCLAVCLICGIGIYATHRFIKKPTWHKLKRVLQLALLVIAILPLILSVYLCWCLLAGQPQTKQSTLAPGVTYTRHVLTTPRQIVAHVIQIDLSSGCRVTTTAPHWSAQNTFQLKAQTTTHALEHTNADLAINASFFFPFKDKWFLDYAPHSEDWITPVGTTIYEGRVLGTDNQWPSLCIQKEGQIYIGSSDSDTQHAVSGNMRLLQDGAITNDLDNDQPYPRTSVAINNERNILWLIAIDGKQPRYSLGMTAYELALFLKQLGASDAINLDGGGSVSLAHRITSQTSFKQSQIKPLNRPCHTKIPRRQRPIANHLFIHYPTTTTTPTTTPATATIPSDHF